MSIHRQKEHAMLCLYSEVSVPKTATTHTRDQLQIQKTELKLLQRYRSMRKPCAPA